jgi:hypothetical protein
MGTTHNQKAAKTAMFTAPVNFAAPRASLQFTVAHTPLSYNHHGAHQPRIRALADSFPHGPTRRRTIRTVDAKERFTWPSSWLPPKNKC